MPPLHLPIPSPNSNGNACPCTHPCRQPHWIIVDSLQGGSGQAFDWRQLRQQAAGFAPLATHGWLLAGGLTADSVAGEDGKCHRKTMAG